MKLGAMLVRDGRLTSAQVEAALAQQARVGGRLGTVLVEMRLIDAETLTVYLGLELGIPIATRAAMDRAKRAAVRLLTPELAERFLCVPIVLQDRQLIAAMRDPHDLLALDELASHTGYRIIPRVAPEVRLYYYLERYYGVPRPDRYRRMGDAIAIGAPKGSDYVEPPPPPLPGLPPPVERPITAPPVPQVIRLAPVAEDDDLAIELEADSAEEAAAAGAPLAAIRPSSPAARSLDAAPPPPPPTAAPAPTAIPEEPSLELDDAVTAMRAATTRGEIAAAIVGHARTLFDAAALLVVRDDLAYGWRGFGRDLDADRIETLLIPLESASIFRQAVEAGGLYVGAAPPSAFHAHLFKVLRARPPHQAVVVPITIKDRVVNLLYGHKEGEGELSELSLDGLRILAKSASEAYVRLIALQKQGG
jgi:hypothetical protein